MPELFEESTLHGQQDDAVQIELGTIGWDDDDIVDMGTADNDGHTFVKVTLYRGRDRSKPIETGVAQGRQILVNISAGMFWLPPKGTRVIVAFPYGMSTNPGVGTIIGAVQTSPTIQFARDRAVMDFGPDTHVVIKGKSVTISDYGSPACFVGVGTPRGGGARGVYALDETGSGFTTQSAEVGAFATSGGAAKTILQLTATKASMLSNVGGQVSGFQLDSGKAIALGAGFYAYTAAVYLGANALAANPVATQAMGAMPSTVVFAAIV